MKRSVLMLSSLAAAVFSTSSFSAPCTLGEICYFPGQGTEVYFSFPNVEQQTPFVCALSVDYLTSKKRPGKAETTIAAKMYPGNAASFTKGTLLAGSPQVIEVQTAEHAKGDTNSSIKFRLNDDRTYHSNSVGVQCVAQAPAAPTE